MYFPSGEGVQRQPLAPSWQTDAQTPLNWGEDTPDSSESLAPQGIPFEATEREVVVPATYLAPNPPSVQTAPAAPPASPQMTRFQILRDIWDKYEARKQAELDAHNNAVASRSEQSSSGAVQSQVSGETPPQRRIQPRRRRGAVVDITPPKQLPITGSEAPDQNDNQDFFFVGGDTPSPSTTSEPSGGIQRDYTPPDHTEPANFSAQTFERGDEDRPESVQYSAGTTAEPINSISGAAPIQREVSDPVFAEAAPAYPSPSNSSGDDAASWQPNGMIYMPSDNPLSPQPPAAAQPSSGAVQMKRAPDREPAAPPAYLADTQVSQVTPLHTTAAVQPSRDRDEEGAQTEYSIPPVLDNDTPEWESSSGDSDGWRAQITPAVQQQTPVSSQIQPMRDEIAPAYNSDHASFAQETTYQANAALPSASSVKPPAQSDFTERSGDTGVPSPSDEGWKAEVTPKSSPPAQAVQPKRDQPQANTPSVITQAGSPGTFESLPSPPTQPSIQTKREPHVETVPGTQNIGTLNISPRDDTVPKQNIPSADAAVANWHAQSSPASFQDAPTTLEPLAPGTSTPAAVQTKRDKSDSSNTPPSAQPTQPTTPALQPQGSSADSGESWISMVSESPTTAQFTPPSVQASRSEYSTPGTGFSASAAEDAPTVFNLPAAAPPSIQTSRPSSPSDWSGGVDNYANWQPSAELAPEPAPDFAPPSPWLNFMSPPEPADTRSPSVPAPSSPARSRVQRKRSKQQPTPDQGAPSYHMHHPDSTPLTSSAEPTWATSEPDLQRDSGDYGVPQQNVDVFTALYQAGMIKEPIPLPPNDAPPSTNPTGSSPSASGSIQRAPDPFSSIPEPGSVEAGLLAMLNLPPDTPVAGLRSSAPSQPTHYGTQQPSAPNISRAIDAGSTGKAPHAQPSKPSSPSMASAATMTPPAHTTTTISNPPHSETSSDSPTIQRVITSGEGQPNSQTTDDSTPQSESPEVNVDRLAREVYDILRSKLRSELERKGGI